MNFGHMMKAAIDLRIIISDLALLQFASCKEKELSLEQVLKFKAKLDVLMKRLPTTLAPHRISIPCHFNIQ